MSGSQKWKKRNFAQNHQKVPFRCPWPILYLQCYVFSFKLYWNAKIYCKTVWLSDSSIHCKENLSAWPWSQLSISRLYAWCGAQLVCLIGVVTIRSFQMTSRSSRKIFLENAKWHHIFLTSPTYEWSKQRSSGLILSTSVAFLQRILMPISMTRQRPIINWVIINKGCPVQLSGDCSTVLHDCTQVYIVQDFWQPFPTNHNHNHNHTDISVLWVQHLPH